MKTLFVTLILVFTFVTSLSASPGKAPLVLEVTTNDATITEALTATKNALLAEKFIVQGGMQESSFNAMRTTASKADYYIADVVVAMVDGKTKVTITFVKVGSGLLKLEKVAETIKAALQA